MEQKCRFCGSDCIASDDNGIVKPFLYKCGTRIVLPSDPNTKPFRDEVTQSQDCQLAAANLRAESAEQLTARYAERVKEVVEAAKALCGLEDAGFIHITGSVKSVERYNVLKQALSDYDRKEVSDALP